VSDAKQQNLFSEESFPPEPMPWEAAADADRLAAQVVFNRPLEDAYLYLVPDEFREVIGPGQRLQVPFGRGNRLTVGYCVGVGPPPPAGRKLKSIDSVIDSEPLLSPKMLELTRWIAERYLCGWGQVLESVIPAGVRNKAVTRQINYFQPAAHVLAQRSELKLPAKQGAALDALCSAEKPLRVEEITTAAGCGTGPINALREKGLIQTIRQRVSGDVPGFDSVIREDDLTPNDDQQQALDTILSTLQSGKHRTILLHGVTGSGKTEVYIQAIREVVSYGRQAIVLVPEISLTPQTIRRFRSRFDSVAVLHSHLSDAERHWQWQQIAQAGVQVIVGARSAIFAPAPHLGLIVIDEEHETSFKQETTPRYHTRDVARERARLENIPLVLGSATPTLESWQRAIDKHDTLISLPKRVAGLPMPPVVVVDIRNDPYCSQGAGIGRALQTAMRSALEDGGQVILFLNLRGFSTTLWCRRCGEAVKCPNCDISLTWHRDREIALCHSCDYHRKLSRNCPECDHPGIRYLGIGTQKLEQEVRAAFREFKILRMDSDSMRKRGSHDRALESFRKGEVQILLGTQMIAKGLDFPNVTLVGVINADTMLHQPDLRATERTFQLISQVAGRTGRSHRGGRVFVQSSSPAEPAILKAAEHDYLGFARYELAHRRELNYPPFQKLTRIILRGPDVKEVRSCSREMADVLKESIEKHDLPIRLLGPAPAPIEKLKSKYRFHLQLAAEEIEPIQTLWHSVADALPRPKNVEYVIDVEPISMR
jgi:primosomal protein N' (replication factor Y)